MKAKKIFTWSDCPFCPNESDAGYEIDYQGKRIIICLECYKSKKYKEVKNGNIIHDQRNSENLESN